MISILIEKILKEKILKEKDVEEHFSMTIGKTFYITILISIISAILSWRCNSIANYPITTKLLCSIYAFFNGIFYLIFYIIMYFNYRDTLCTIS